MVPVMKQWPGVLAVNVGGAAIPTILSIYQFVRIKSMAPRPGRVRGLGRGSRLGKAG